MDLVNAATSLHDGHASAVKADACFVSKISLHAISYAAVISIGFAREVVRLKTAGLAEPRPHESVISVSCHQRIDTRLCNIGREVALETTRLLSGLRWARLNFE
jgi:hypothetical protein